MNKIIKDNNKIDLSLTKCKVCGKQEYKNCIIIQTEIKHICRDCYYKQLEKETKFKRVPAVDHIFPYYKNGINYINKK